MNNLEKEIYEKLMRYEDASEDNIMTGSVCNGHAKAAASVAMRWIEKAFEAGSVYGYARAKGLTMNDGTRALNCSDWLIFNGLTPTEPDTKEPISKKEVDQHRLFLHVVAVAQDNENPVKYLEEHFTIKRKDTAHPPTPV